MPSIWSPPAPMLAPPTSDPALAQDQAAEPQWDGYWALVGRWSGGRVLIRSLAGGMRFPDLAQIFPGSSGRDHLPSADDPRMVVRT